MIAPVIIVVLKMFDDVEYQRIYWHSRRGMLELDLVLMPFVEHRLRTLDEEDQRRYVRMLECEDQDMFGWFLKRKKPEDKDLARIVDLILDYAQHAKD